MKYIRISKPRRVVIGNGVSIEEELMEDELESLAGDIQNWLMTHKGILADFKINVVRE